MELRQLAWFVRLADTLHFGRAARELHVTPSALSQQVRKLEREVGTPLLERTSRTARLTPAGAAFVTEAIATLAQAEHALAAARAHADGRRGELVLGMLDEGAAELNVPLLQRLKAACPGLHVTVRAVEHGEHLEVLEAGQVDALLGASVQSVDPERFLVTPLFADGRLAVLPVAHPLADATEVTVADFLEESFLDLAAPPQFTAHWELAYARGGEPPRKGRPLSAHHVSTMPELLMRVALGEGLITVTTANERFWPHPQIVYRPMPEAPTTDMLLISNVAPDDRPRPVLEHLYTVASAVARELTTALVPGASPVVQPPTSVPR